MNARGVAVVISSVVLLECGTSSPATPDAATGPTDSGSSGDGAPIRCNDTGVVTLASGGYAAGPVAVTATDVYWTSLGGNTVSKVPICGGAVTTLAVNIQGNVPFSVSAFQDTLAVDATDVYWSAPTASMNANGWIGGPNVVLKVPVAGGTPSTLASNAGGVALDSANVYWAEIDGIVKEPLAGGTPAPVAPNGGGPFTIDATNVYWLQGGAFNAFAVIKAPLSGGAPVTLASGANVNGAASLAVDATSVYWTNRGGSSPGAGSVVKVPIAGGTPTTLVSGLDYPLDVAVDASNVYFTTEGTSSAGGAVMRVAVSGGAPTTLWSAAGVDASRFVTASGIALDASYLYWTTAPEGTPGSVMRMAK
jgi:hypothetical protein